MGAQPSKLDRQLAKVCLNSPVCRQARRKPRGLAFWFVKRAEGKLCPFCRAYERVDGRKAHESGNKNPGVMNRSNSTKTHAQSPTSLI